MPRTTLRADRAGQRTSAPAATHRPGLDGLRGLAVAAVVAYHLDLVPGGFLGVDVFFVLSGYLITGLVLDEVARTGAVSLRSFWGRRARRLVPALVAVVSGVLAAAVALDWPGHRRRALGIDAIATLSWWANWRQAGGASYWDSGEDLFRHAWSLAIEEQFYVVWPLAVMAVLVVLRRLGRTHHLPRVLGVVAAAGVLISGGWALVLAHRVDPTHLSRIYVGTDTRVLAPLLGCALACVARVVGPRWRRSRTSVLAATMSLGVLAAMVARTSVDDPATYRHGGLLVAAAVAGIAVWGAALAEPSDRDPLGWLTTRPIARYLGARSYAIYLWSWPVQVLVRFRWPDTSTTGLAVVTISASLVLAELSQRVVEAPLRFRSGWAATPTIRRISWASGGVVAVVALSAALVTAKPVPRHLAVGSDEAAREALRPAATTIPPRGPGTDADAGVVNGSTSTETGEAPGLRVLLTGDSVAWTVGYYKPSADDLPTGIASIDSRAIIGCGLLSGEGWEFPRHGDGPFEAPAADACADQPAAEELGFEGRPDVLVLMPGAWEWTDARSPDGEVVAARSDEMRELLTDRLLRKVRQADEIGAATVLVEWSCPGRLAAPTLRDPDYIDWINAMLADVAATARGEGISQVHLLAPTDRVCERGDPTAAPTEAKARATDDEVHVVSLAGGRWVWDAWLAPGIRSLM